MRSPSPQPAFVFAAIFVFIFILHTPLLNLPYFWDEAGYYVPAARDILLGGSFIPHSTLSNAHPPLVMAWLAACWKVAGYAPMVTRTAMLSIAAFSLLGVFRLALRVANPQVAAASTLCTALYPVFFAQSSLAQVDLAAAGLTCWAICAFLEDSLAATAVWFSLAVLAKETAVLAPVALVAWEVVGLLGQRSRLAPYLWMKRGADREPPSGALGRIAAMLAPLLPLAAWYSYHYFHTGYIFGNPEFFRYNVASTLNLTRFLLALLMRLWQAFGYLHLWVLTLGMALAMLLPPLPDSKGERPRIAVPIQLVFLVVISAYVVAMALIGGAVLARYMLPAIPLVIIASVSTLWRRLRLWPAAVAFVAFAFVAGWFWNPPYGFSPEDNLAYRDYVRMHQRAEQFLEARYPMARVLTAWPASDELARPWLGYLSRPVQVVRIEDFSLEQVLSAADYRSNFEVALIFSTKYEPAHPILDRGSGWDKLKARFFGFHRDLPPAAAARMLGGHIVFSEERQGQWIGVIELEHLEDAKDRLPPPKIKPQAWASGGRRPDRDLELRAIR
jgi:hypothetical protein